jgi:Fe-S-cluster containining protein
MAPESDVSESPDNPLRFIRKPTLGLRAMVSEQHGALSPSDFAGMMGEIRSLFEKYSRALGKAGAGSERARVLHGMMETATASASEIQVSCRRGCCGCCHSEVEVTQDEAILLRELVDGGLGIDRERLRVQASRERLSPEWQRFWSPENRCVFLNPAGECGIYAERPAACRKLLVTTPAEWCTTPGSAVSPVRILLAEIVISAALSMDGAVSASISKMLGPLLTPS